MSNILSEVHPELVAEWSDKNLPLTPDRITYGSNKVVWWKGACGHEWQTGAFPAALPLSGVATGKSIVRNAPTSHTKDSRQSTQEENGQSRKIGAEKASNIKTFQLPHFEG